MAPLAPPLILAWQSRAEPQQMLAVLCVATLQARQRCLEVCISHIGTLPAANGADPQTTAPELASASLGARWANQPGTGRGR
ncbi:uncharacterized [Tachysurus ichikawai]